MESHWQHEAPLRCPIKHEMLWLGQVYWMCPKCKEIYVQTTEQKNTRIKALKGGE